ncbi:peptidoglycan editing factor PgeF [Vogesella oryzae]|uniref:peptidoglycan editing factor PgeF n=1 Tax=Vogesella oryzae TaxID=1735285 RepID=UPI0015819FC6|nr:peptidoglycan editing factor PgeF [Vogesella oryzae]
MSHEWITPEWPLAANVGSLITTRSGGVSPAPYNSLNLGDHVGDSPANVAANRAALRDHLPADPAWLEQVHGTVVVDAATVAPGSKPKADASFSRTPGVVCAIMTADCLPVLLADRAGTVVGAAHAGWRGLCNGVIEATVQAMNEPAANLVAYLGPAIGPDAFEVGAEVRDAFLAHDIHAVEAFQPIDDGKYLADIYLLARQRLAALGVTEIYGGDACTVIERNRFFSYRRDGVTGRMASLIWIS